MRKEDAAQTERGAKPNSNSACQRQPYMIKVNGVENIPVQSPYIRMN